MAKIRKRILVRQIQTRIQTLEAAAMLRRQGENQLNRRIDSLIELVTEMDNKLDALELLLPPPLRASSNRDNSNISDVT